MRRCIRISMCVEEEEEDEEEEDEEEEEEEDDDPLLSYIVKMAFLSFKNQKSI